MTETKFDQLARERSVGDDVLVRFLQVQRACKRNGPTMSELAACVKRGTTDGVLESALHLSVEEYDTLEEMVKRERAKAPNLPKIRRRKS